MTSSERLRQAADKVRRCGLNQFSFIGPKGEVCSLQALGWAATADCDLDRVVLACISDVVGQRIIGTYDICDWNNVRGRTADDVATAFEAAARLAEQRQAN